MKLFFAHLLLSYLTKLKRKHFLNKSFDLKQQQLLILNKILGISYEELRNNYNLTNYQNYESEFLNFKISGNVQMVPTSGSTRKIKWLPYTKEFKKELWNASSVILGDLYLSYPKIKKGTHYWSLSWLPKELRVSNSNNDLEFFDGVEKWILTQVMSVNEKIQQTESLHESLLETLIQLLNKKVTLVSVWSPTFFLEILNLLNNFNDDDLERISSVEKRKIVKKISNGKIPCSDEFMQLFPDLVILSSWDSSSSKIFANKLKELFSYVEFIPKGLWTTEGVITIPFENHFVLSYQSHFYEFMDCSSREVVPAWMLKKDQVVFPILTTSSGIKRYLIEDRLLVYAFFNSLPCLKFLGRDRHVDLVGEKISTNISEEVIKKTQEKFNLFVLSLIGVETPKPHYCLLVSKNENVNMGEVQTFVEDILLENFHYKLARELNQLDGVRFMIAKNPIEVYKKLVSENISILGNMKIETLFQIHSLRLNDIQ